MEASKAPTAEGSADPVDSSASISGADDRRMGEFGFREHLELVRLRPGMYGLDGSYADLVTYLDGYDAGSRDTALLGFREWLALKLNGGTNLIWSALVVRLLVPDSADRPYRSFDQQQNGQAVVGLFALLSEFLRERDSDRDGLRRILSVYTMKFGE